MHRRFVFVVVSVVALLAMSVAIVGCSSAPTPTETVDNALKALKAEDYETLAKYYNGDMSSLQDPEKALQEAGSSDLGLDTSTNELTAEQKEIGEELVAKALDFDYTLSNEKVDGDKATVDVTITTYDFGTAATEFLSKYMTQALASALTGKMSEDDYTDQAFKLLKEQIDKLGNKDTSATVAVGLTKDSEGSWKVDDLEENSEFADALLGGMASKIADLANSLGTALESSSTQ